MSILPDSQSLFTSLQLAEPLQRALKDKKYTHPSPIQSQTLPYLLEGRDVIGIAQTGTGKTAAFALPILQRLAIEQIKPQPNRPRALVLAPTRELAVQIGESFASYGKYLSLRISTVFGGVGYGNQIRDLKRGVDVLVATPGRLLDLMQQKHVQLDRAQTFVLDEVDRMLDMGFVHDVKRLIALLPKNRQSVLFSATFPRQIEEIASSFVSNAQRINIAPTVKTVEKIQQRVCHVDQANKYDLLVHLIQQQPANALCLVFAEMKHSANRLAERLEKDGYKATAIHGNKSQAARQRALEDFRRGKAQILVATDVAARGIDVKGIQLVVNFDLPREPESYVHRIGRTARAGAEGLAIAFCSSSERGNLKAVQRIIDMEIPVLAEHPYHCEFKDRSHKNTQSERPERRGGMGNRKRFQSSGKPSRGGFGERRGKRPFAKRS